MSRSLLALIVLGVVECLGGCHHPSGAVATPAATAKTYAIVLDRGTQAGARMHLAVETEQRSAQRTFEGKRVVRRVEDRMRLVFEGDARVLAVSSEGAGAAMELSVARFVVAQTDGVPHEVVPAGKRITLVRAAEKDAATLSIDGAPADAATRAAFDDVIRLRQSSSDVDGALGTSAPQPVGGSWTIDAEATRRDLLLDAGLDGTVEGGCRLDRATEGATGTTLTVACGLRARITAWRGLDAGLRLRRGALNADVRSVAPPGELGESDTSFHAELWVDGVRNGRPLELEIVQDQHQHKLWTPL